MAPTIPWRVAVQVTRSHFIRWRRPLCYSNNAVIPNKGHYLCVNSVGYSLASYPAGNGTTATGDANFTTDIPDNAGIAVFNTSVAVDFTLANRLDAVGSTSEANTTYKEGTGYPALTPFSIDYSFIETAAASLDQ